MKRDKHPETHTFKVTLTNGDQITVRTTVPNKKDMKLEIDTFNHPAWVAQEKSRTDLFTEVVKFKDKFKDLEGL